MGMPLLRFLFRKMWNTRWLTLSTLAGLIVAVAFTTSIPMYSDGSLKRVVSQRLQEENKGLPSGAILMRYQAVGSDRATVEELNELQAFLDEDVPNRIGFHYNNYVTTLSLRSSRVTPEDPDHVEASRRRQMTLTAQTGLADNIELTSGVLYSDQVKDGYIEAIVLEDSMYRNNFRVGDTFKYPVAGASGVVLKIKVVGAFQPQAGKDIHDVYWYQGIEGMVNNFMISEQVFKEEVLTKKKVPLDLGNWYFNFDLREIKTSELGPLARTLERLDNEVYQLLKNTRIDISFLPMLNDFRQESLRLQTLLFTLAAPMIAMVFYYIAMNSRQSLERQRSDVAVLRSRGGSTRQIFYVYLLEGLFLGAIALLIGPAIGWLMAKSIGSSNGFLSFVNRKSVPIDVSLGTMLYGIIAVLIALVASLVPAISYARSSIVNLKQQMARKDRKPVWQRWYLDIVLLGVSAYGWYLFYERQFITLQTGVGSDQIQTQPLLFFIPAVTIFSIGLFFLRMFPLLLKLFTLLGRKLLPVPLHLTLTQLSRSSNAYYPLMLLLVLTLGLGVYNSSTARTIDLNSTERTLYEFGADVTIETVWEAFAEFRPTTPPPSQQPGGGEGENPGNGGQNPGGGGGGQNPGQQPTAPPNMLFREPPFEAFKELPGVEAATRVLIEKGNAVVSGRTAGQGTVFGIDNTEFTKVGWFRNNDLLPHHQNFYLNLLGEDYYDNGVLIPENFAERHQLEPGDVMNISISQQSLEFVVVGIVPYWPSQYPDQRPFFIVNLDYIYDELPIIPYQVWIKMKEGAEITPLVEAMAEKGIDYVEIKDARIELANQARHPERGGVFGILSLGFLVSVLISLVGYVLYWFFNLSSRVLQFGILRAMGLSRRQLTGMLLLEQGFTAGLAILLGILIGKLASYLYLPFLQTSGDARMQVPPFRVVFNSQDTVQLYIIVCVMMLIGAALLIFHIRRLRVHQAVKLGEER